MLRHLTVLEEACQPCQDVREMPGCQRNVEDGGREDRRAGGSEAKRDARGANMYG